MMKLFTKQNCQNCEWVKERLLSTDNIEIIDCESTNGLAEMAYYEIISIAEKRLPILVTDDEIIVGTIAIKNYVESQRGV